MESAGWCELGIVYHEQGDHVNAQRCAMHALQIAPGSSNALNLLGMIQLADPATTLEAAEAFRQALAADPQDPFSQNNLGVASIAKSDYAGAEQHFRRALAGQPAQPLFRRNLYAALRHQSRPYRLLTLPCQLSLWLSGTYCGYLGIAIGAGLWVFILNILKDPYGPFQDIRLGLLGVIVWLILVWWPSLKLYERLTLRDVQARRARSRPGLDAPRSRPGARGATRPLRTCPARRGHRGRRRHLHPLVETFFAAFLVMSAISTGASLLIVKMLETLMWRARSRRLLARQGIR